MSTLHFANEWSCQAEERWQLDYSFLAKMLLILHEFVDLVESGCEDGKMKALKRASDMYKWKKAQLIGRMSLDSWYDQ